MSNLTTYEEIVKFSRRAIEETKRPNCDGTYSESSIDRNDVIKHHELIADACEKQLEKKPKTITSASLRRSGWKVQCSRCKRALDESYYNCPGCGQKIGWED